MKKNLLFAVFFAFGFNGFSLAEVASDVASAVSGSSPAATENDDLRQKALVNSLLADLQTPQTLDVPGFMDIFQTLFSWNLFGRSVVSFAVEHILNCFVTSKNAFLQESVAQACWFLPLHKKATALKKKINWGISSRVQAHELYLSWVYEKLCKITDFEQCNLSCEEIKLLKDSAKGYHLFLKNYATLLSFFSNESVPENSVAIFSNKKTLLESFVDKYFLASSLALDIKGFYSASFASNIIIGILLRCFSSRKSVFERAPLGLGLAIYFWLLNEGLVKYSAVYFSSANLYVLINKLMLSVVVSKNYKKYRAVSIAIFEKLQATSDQDLQNEFRGYPGLLSLLFQSKDDYRDFLRNSEQIHKMATTIAGS